MDGAKSMLGRRTVTSILGTPRESKSILVYQFA